MNIEQKIKANSIEFATSLKDKNKDIYYMYEISNKNKNKEYFQNLGVFVIVIFRCLGIDEAVDDVVFMDKEYNVLYKTFRYK